MYVTMLTSRLSEYVLFFYCRRHKKVLSKIYNIFVYTCDIVWTKVCILINSMYITFMLHYSGVVGERCMRRAAYSIRGLLLRVVCPIGCDPEN